MKLKFPKGFLWGASTSAYQIEGNNRHSDWWIWEKDSIRIYQLTKEGKNPRDYYSDIACNSYSRFEEDFSLAKKMHHNAHRLSIEWARIQPEEGKFDKQALEHYKQVFSCAKKSGFTLFVTLHHFTSPYWFSKKGGFLKKENLTYFYTFVEKVVEEFKDDVDFWITFNEPTLLVAMHTPFENTFSPLPKNILSTFAATQNIILAHNTVSDIVQKVTKKPVGIAHNQWDIQTKGRGSLLLTRVYNYFFNEYIFRRTINTSDFIGINYYNSLTVRNFGLHISRTKSHERSDIGWTIIPEGLERVLLRFKTYGKPIYITENGIADAKDTRRAFFIKEHLYYLHRAIQKGVDVKGYLYWSLLDNFEWKKGFSPRFGLVEIDREKNLKRKIRSSAQIYARICKDNALEC